MSRQARRRLRGSRLDLDTHRATCAGAGASAGAGFRIGLPWHGVRPAGAAARPADARRLGARGGPPRARLTHATRPLRLTHLRPTHLCPSVQGRLADAEGCFRRATELDSSQSHLKLVRITGESPGTLHSFDAHSMRRSPLSDNVTGHLTRGSQVSTTSAQFSGVRYASPQPRSPCAQVMLSMRCAQKCGTLSRGGSRQLPAVSMLRCESAGVAQAQDRRSFPSHFSWRKRAWPKSSACYSGKTRDFCWAVGGRV